MDHVLLDGTISYQTNLIVGFTSQEGYTHKNIIVFQTELLILKTLLWAHSIIRKVKRLEGHHAEDIRWLLRYRRATQIE